MKVSRTPPAIILTLISLSLSACQMHKEEQPQQEHHKIVVTSPQIKDIIVTQPYVCLIHSQNHIDVCPMMSGYLEKIPVKEGQAVKKGDVMFQILPTLYKAKYDAEVAEARFAQVELDNSKSLLEQKVVSVQELALFEAKLAKAEAKVKQSQAELNFATYRAPFDGIIDRLLQQQGSLIKERDILTTLSDNSIVWVYFNVPEARYLEFKALHKSQDISQLKLVDSRIELMLANGRKFDQNPGNTVTIEGQFDNRTGNIQFRADFPNPERLLRHGQTGTVLIHRSLHDAVVIPQRATFEILDKQYVYVVGEDHVVHRRPITVQYEKDDIFVIESGIGVNDKIILEGVRQVTEGDKVEFEFRNPDEALANQKNHAE